MDPARLESVRPFEALTPAERRMLASVLDESSAETGATIMRQGEHGYEFIVIEEGTVDVFHNGEKVDTMGPGDFFGELAVIAAGGERNATIVATSPLKMLTLTSHYMREIRSRMPSLGEQIDSVIAARTR